MFRAVVFDLDGTLVESAPDLHAAVTRLLEERGLAPPSLAEVRGMIGHGIPRLVEQALAAAGAPAEGTELEAAVARFRDIYGRDPARHSHANPGAAAALGRLAAMGLRLGVCTNKAEAISRRILADLGLDRHLAVVVGGDTAGAMKPDPKPLLRALERLGASPAEALYVGDSEIDAETAARAGIRFALFTGGYRRQPLDAFDAWAVFDDFTALAGRLAACTGKSAG